MTGTYDFTIGEPHPRVAVKQRFTLIELLVVTGVIAILAGMLMPALTKARAKAVEANLTNSVRQLHLALLMYYDSNDDNQYIPNTLDGGIGVDFEALKPHGFVPKMMEDPFRAITIDGDLTLQEAGIEFNGNSFHESGSGLIYLNFHAGNLPFTLDEFNTKSGYGLPDDTEWVVIGVGMNGQIDWDQPENDMVVIKRESNSNNERWPTF